VSSTISRERAAAKARLERQMAEKLEAARKRKQRNAIIGAAAAVVLVAGGIVWAIMAMPKKADTTASDDVSCIWTPDDATQNPDLKDVGAPPTGKAPHKGTQLMTLDMSLGQVQVEMNTAKAPCTARSMTYLAGKGFFDNTKCHRITTEGIHVLQCGDPAGKGTGGPTYKMAEENLPNFIDDSKNYPVCTVAMAKTQAPNSTGSQFFFVYGDTPLPGQYTMLGKITKGCELIQEAAKAGAVKEDGTPAEGGDGAPKTPILISKVTVTPPQE
jgi:peptidyl-prolyl cis-trans isomerase B (cyclophilin B)